MAEQRVKRRLAAILAADVVGYSRMMEADEAGTLARLKALRREVFEPKTKHFGGRIFKVTGDGALVEFKSAADAVDSAIEIQRALEGNAENFVKGQRIQLRIGISLGDVIPDGTDLYGNGVNIAARLEGLAEPGGICVSGNVHEHVRGASGMVFESLGEQQVKNIERPITCYRIKSNQAGVVESPKISPTHMERPGIAVLPFDNLSADPGQDFLGDGLTEDIITALSAVRSFYVISRNSTFGYKGTSPDVRKVASELGVRYVVEGSARRAGERLRINAQLIDGETAKHLWAERYDRDLADLFQVQDEIVQTVVARLETELGRAERERVKSSPTDKLDAWELYHRGMSAMQMWNRPNLAEARRLFAAAIEKDPNLASAYAGMAWCYAEEFTFGTGDFDRDRAIGAAKHAVALDDQDAFAHFALGWVYHRDKQMEPAIVAAKTAIRLNPSLSYAHTLLAGIYIHGGRPAEGIPHMELAIRLSPNDPQIGLYYSRLAAGYLYSGDFERAVVAGRNGVEHAGNWMVWAVLTSALSHSGMKDEARRACRELARVHPGVTAGFVRTHYITVHQPSMDSLIGGLRDAGLPE